MKKLFNILLFLILIIAGTLTSACFEDANMIKNPVSERISPDPFITYDDENKIYYSVYSTQLEDGTYILKVSRAKKAKEVMDGESVEIFRAGGLIKNNVWAPEMHKGSDGKWYVYTSGFTSPSFNWDYERMFVLRALTDDPFDGFEFVKTFEEIPYAFDPTVFTHSDGKQYMCYTQVMYAFGQGKYEQRLFIREMVSPTELGQEFAQISKAEMPFELANPNEKINEGPFFLPIEDKLFIIYSANGTGNENYCLCVLEYVGGDLVNENSWKKIDQPLLVKSEKLLGPGHASFFYSPDKTEIWCAFHAIIEMDETKEYKDRFTCLNKVEIDENGYPYIGKAKETESKGPSGE